VKTSLRFRQIESGYDFSCGITFDDEIWCWGIVLYGAPEDSISKVPYRVPLPQPVSKIEAGGYRKVCALVRGEVWCMGGQSQEPPHRIDGFPLLVDLSVGTGHICGTTEDQEGWCHGANNSGQRGNGSLSGTSDPPTPVADRSGRAP
jgi:alpha-tubulin suppressor-like RCC1 family protein